MTSGEGVRGRNRKTPMSDQVEGKGEEKCGEPEPIFTNHEGDVQVMALEGHVSTEPAAPASNTDVELGIEEWKASKMLMNMSGPPSGMKRTTFIIMENVFYEDGTPKPLPTDQQGGEQIMALTERSSRTRHEGRMLVPGHKPEQDKESDFHKAAVRDSSGKSDHNPVGFSNWGQIMPAGSTSGYSTLMALGGGRNQENADAQRRRAQPVCEAGQAKPRGHTGGTGQQISIAEGKGASPRGEAATAEGGA